MGDNRQMCPNGCRGGTLPVDGGTGEAGEGDDVHSLAEDAAVHVLDEDIDE